MAAYRLFYYDGGARAITATGPTDQLTVQLVDPTDRRQHFRVEADGSISSKFFPGSVFDLDKKYKQVTRICLYPKSNPLNDWQKWELNVSLLRSKYSDPPYYVIRSGGLVLTGLAPAPPDPITFGVAPNDINVSFKNSANTNARLFEVHLGVEIEIIPAIPNGSILNRVAAVDTKFVARDTAGALLKPDSFVATTDGQAFEILPVNVPAVPIDLVLMIDSTNSMQAFLTEAKNKITAIVAEIKRIQPSAILRIAIVGYRDYIDGISDHFVILDFVTDVPTVQLKLGSIVATGGGDGPEDIAGALQKVKNLTWTSTGCRVLIHIGDCPPHGTRYSNLPDTYPGGDPNGLVPEALLGQLLDMGVEYYFLKISTFTDQMLTVFGPIFLARGKELHVYPLSTSAADLAPLIITCVTSALRITLAKVH